MTAPAYQPVTRAENRAIQGPRPGTQTLLNVILMHTMLRGARSGGIYANRTVRFGKSLSLHSAGRACDVMVPATNGVATTAGRQLGDELFLRCVAAAEQCGICEVIWWDKRWTSAGVKPYKHTNHRDHVHIGQTIDMASRTDPQLGVWFNHFLFER